MLLLVTKAIVSTIARTNDLHCTVSLEDKKKEISDPQIVLSAFHSSSPWRNFEIFNTTEVHDDMVRRVRGRRFSKLVTIDL